MLLEQHTNILLLLLCSLCRLVCWFIYEHEIQMCSLAGWIFHAYCCANMAASDDTLQSKTLVMEKKIWGYGNQTNILSDYTLVQIYSQVVYSDFANKPGQLLHTRPLTSRSNRKLTRSQLGGILYSRSTCHGGSQPSIILLILRDKGSIKLNITHSHVP